jgi:hypothetical protein
MKSVLSYDLFDHINQYDDWLLDDLRMLVLVLDRHHDGVGHLVIQTSIRLGLVEHPLDGVLDLKLVVVFGTCTEVLLSSLFSYRHRFLGSFAAVPYS